MFGPHHVCDFIELIYQRRELCVGLGIPAVWPVWHHIYVHVHGQAIPLPSYILSRLGMYKHH